MINSSIEKKFHLNCLLCGKDNPWSFGVKFYGQENGSVTGQFQSHANLQGYDGILHGGVITALLDAAMTHSLFHQGIEAVTGDMRIRFLHPIPCEALLDLKGHVVSERSRLYVVQAEIHLKERLMAKGEAKFMARVAPL